jgi:hypothetical protein
MDGETSLSGWVINGFHAVVVLWAWMVLVLLHAAWRSLQGPETDPIRPSGPGA